MAMLHYQNLGVHRPDILMKNVFFGLRTFYDFLSRTKDYMESDAAVKRLAWKPGVLFVNAFWRKASGGPYMPSVGQNG